MERHNIHHHCFQVSTTERVSSSPSILSKALFPPFGSLWLSKTSRWHFFRYNFDHIPSIWKTCICWNWKPAPKVIVVLSNLDNQDYPAFWPTSPSTPIMWDAGYSQYTVTITSQDEFLPRWDITIIIFVIIIIITLIINKSIIQFVFHHHYDLKSFSPQDNQTAAWIWDNVEGGIFGEVFMTLKLDLSGCRNNSTARQQK